MTPPLDLILNLSDRFYLGFYLYLKPVPKALSDRYRSTFFNRALIARVFKPGEGTSIRVTEHCSDRLRVDKLAVGTGRSSDRPEGDRAFQ